MSSYVPAVMRLAVAERAGRRCEYCQIHERDTTFGCEIEHVISEKHGGLTTLENLAWSCFFCNRFKGTDLGSISTRSGQLTRLFNPRTDRWSDHFLLQGFLICPLSEIGEVTVRLLQMNSVERIFERQAIAEE